MALRALSAIRILKMAVEVGFVVGKIAATTPTGSAISIMPFSRSSRMMPTVVSGRIAR
jgi:hypothetical protein